MNMSVILTGCLLFSGCSLIQPRQPITEVKIPVRVSCVETVPAKPAFKTDAELKALDDYRLAFSLLKDRADRQIYEGELEAVVAGCM